MPKEKKILWEGKYLRLCEAQSWEWIERVHSTGVVMILAMTAQRKVVLVEQYRVPVQGPAIEFPAGLVGDNGSEESMETAARREFLEETGYRAKRWTLLTEGPPSPGMSSEKISIYLAEDLEKAHDGGGDATESILVHEIPMKEVHAWLESQRTQGKHVDPKVYAGLYFLTSRLS
jgi:ADP-ribose pyrophosphatase